MTAVRASSLLFALLGSFMLVSAAAADEVVLRSGERLTGRIVDKSSEAVVLETASNDNLRIRWEQIVALRTDAPMDAMLTHEDGAARMPMADSAVQRADLRLLQSSEAML